MLVVFIVQLPIECKEIKLDVNPFPVPLQEFEKFVSCMLYYRDTLYVAIKKVILYFDAKVEHSSRHTDTQTHTKYVRFCNQIKPNDKQLQELTKPNIDIFC
jgi:hypothetical protein